MTASVLRFMRKSPTPSCGYCRDRRRVFDCFADRWIMCPSCNGRDPAPMPRRAAA